MNGIVWLALRALELQHFIELPVRMGQTQRRESKSYETV